MNANQPLIEAPHAALESIEDDIDALESLLEPLTSAPLSEMLEKLSVIQRAKLCTLLPYVVHSLMLAYLKTNGVDPRTHQVMEEMKRIKKYMEKISDAGRANQNLTHSKLDTQVANRFIKGAIASAAASSRPASGSNPKTTIGVIGNHLHFDVKGEALTERAAAKITARMDVDDEEEEENSSDEGLEVVGGALGDLSGPTAKASGSFKGKNKETPNIKSLGRTTDPLIRNKRKRPHMDPFTGYSVGVSSSLQDGNDSAMSSSRATPVSLAGDTGTATGTEASEAGKGNGKGGRKKMRSMGWKERRKLKETGGGGES